MHSSPQSMEFNKFAMILTNNKRSKAYLQGLLGNGMQPTEVIFMNPGNQNLVEQTNNDRDEYCASQQSFMVQCPEAQFSFDEKKHIKDILSEHQILTYEIFSIDINSADMISAIKTMQCKYIIFSGPGGAILRSTVLNLGKVFLHVHPGWLPSHKGSTVFYYSYLLNSEVGCSVISFTEEIDEGPIYHREKFHITETKDFDNILDPAIRARTLINFMQKFFRHPLEISHQNSGEGYTFFIIHPLLKHLALLKK